MNALEGEERQEFEEILKQSTLEMKTYYNQMKCVMLHLPASVDLVEPPLVKEKLIKRIKQDSILKHQEFRFVFKDEGEWIHVPNKGVTMKLLSINHEKKYVTLLMKMEANTYYSAHHHAGPEECYIIEGDLEIHGNVLGPGDFHHAEAGSDHGDIFSKYGCTALLVADTEDYLAH